MNLYGLTLAELQVLVADLDQPSYRARQIAEWLYHHHVESVDAMTNLPRGLKESLSEGAGIRTPAGSEAGESTDGTARWVWDTFGGDLYESAVIPDRRRLTLCVSSQSGCRVGCAFCLTARIGLRQDLSPAEIVGQFRNVTCRDSVTHVVFMGMGEPLHNLEALMSSLEILTSPWGYGISPRRITVSTVGILPQLERLLDRTDVNVALSVHAARTEERLRLVPSERDQPVATTIDLLRHRARLALPPFTGIGRRRVSIEMTLMDGVNDSVEHARALRELLADLPVRVNLIPWNAFPGARFRSSSPQAIERYQEVLKASGLITTIRQSRGQDIGAACGLLAGRRASAEKPGEAGTPDRAEDVGS